ncbi:hypothetical protein [Parashewanella tropica]|uniref:hypothetical protein n=1 Tax=Parashewanella tropica TaxID=2547970 RepID=UPI00105A7AA3|nr:hypothetical protein [Parashewanella tropica]
MTAACAEVNRVNELYKLSWTFPKGKVPPIKLREFSGTVKVRITEGRCESITIRYQYRTTLFLTRELILFFEGYQADSVETLKVARAVENKFFTEIIPPPISSIWKDHIFLEYDKGLEDTDWVIVSGSARFDLLKDESSDEHTAKKPDPIPITSEKTPQPVLKIEPIELPVIGTLPRYVEISENGKAGEKVHLHEHRDMIIRLGSEVSKTHRSLSGQAKKNLLLSELVVMNQLLVASTNDEISFGQCSRALAITDMKIPILINNKPCGYFLFESMRRGSQIVVSMFLPEEKTRKISIELEPTDDSSVLEMEEKIKAEVKLNQSRLERVERTTCLRAQVLEKLLEGCESVGENQQSTHFTREDFADPLSPEQKAFKKKY